MKWCYIRTWLREQYGRTSIPVLVVGILTLIVSVANYSIQRSSYNKPELAPAGAMMHFDLSPKIAELHWLNIGKKPARNGTVTLFIFAEDRTRPHKLGELGQASIAATSTIIGANYLGSAKVTLNSGELSGPFLACVVYYDENDEIYRQAFLYRRGTGGPENIPLDAWAPPPKYSDVCL